MKIVLIAAGAGGMYCGSCLRDNTLARALLEAGNDVLLAPAYTPLRTDEPNVSLPSVFYGGINVFLQQNLALFRKTPRWIDQFLDAPALLRVATRAAGDADPSKLADLTLSVLEGENGNQRKELERLTRWLADDVRPQIINLPNALFVGMAAALRRALNIPIVCTLTGADVFINEMRPDDAQCVKALIHRKAADVDAFIATSTFYADHMAEYYQLPRDRIHVVPSGINLDGCDPTPRERTIGEPFKIGYLARICPQKGLHLLADAFTRLRKMPQAGDCRLLAAGYLSKRQRSYLDGVRDHLTAAGCGQAFEYHGEPDRAEKLAFLRGLDLFSVPATFLEPKGIYLLEALANGVPVVQPAHGAFPELIASTGGGVLCEPNDADALAAALHALMLDDKKRHALAEAGGRAVHAHYSAATMAAATLNVYKTVLDGVGP